MQAVNKVRIFSLIAAFSLALSGCSSNGPGVSPGPIKENPDGPVMNLNGLEFGFVGDANIESDGSSISGSGSLVFRDALTEEDNNFSIRVSLQPGGSVEIIANARSGLVGGAGMIFTRSESNELQLEVNTGDKVFDVTEYYVEEFGSVDATREVFVELDVHGHGHLVLWVNEGDEYQEATRRVNGTVWGLKLNGATLTYAKRSEPKDKH